MTRPIPTLASAASAAAMMALAAPAAAQGSPCGDTYRVEIGDTMARIAQSCRVSLDALIDANPRIDPRSLPVAATLRIPGQERSRAQPQPQAQPAYQQEEDEYQAIAQGIGLILNEVIGEDSDNKDESRFAEAAEASVRPRSGAPGGWVQVAADGFPANSRVAIAAGRANSGYQTLKRATTSNNGSVESEVRIPGWAEPGEELVFVVADGALKARTARVNVTSEDEAAGGRRLQAEGRIEEGVECPILAADDGRTYSLKSDTVDFTEGEHVRVTGYTQDASFCQQGLTLDVTDIEETPGGDRADTVTVRGTVEEGVECRILRTDDGDVYSLAGAPDDLRPGDRAEVSGETDRMSFCMQGTTLDVYSVNELDSDDGSGLERDTNRRALTGRLIDSYRGCMTLRTDDNDIWKLADLDSDQLAGERVTVEGKRPRGEPCGSGRTLMVERIDRAGNDEARARNINGSFLEGPWVRQGDSCARPDFDVTANNAGGYVVETSLNGAPRTGYVRRGSDAAFIFDQPSRVFRLKAITDDRLVVLAPYNALNQEIGGNDISRSGTAFDRCPESG